MSFAEAPVKLFGVMRTSSSTNAIWGFETVTVERFATNAASTSLLVHPGNQGAEVPVTSSIWTSG